MVESESDAVVASLAELMRAAAKLPVCDGSAKLHAHIARVVDDLTHQRDASASLATLVRAAGNALDADPWVRFERAARRLQPGTTPS